MNYSKKYFYLLFLLLFFKCYSSEEKNVTILIDTIKNLSESISQHEINSPAIIQEFYNAVNDLDAYSITMPEEQKNVILQEEENIAVHYAPTYHGMIKNALDTNWHIHQKEIITTAKNVAVAAMSSATLGLFIQGMQMGTGNLLQLDTNTLMINAFTAVMASVVMHLNTKRLGMRPASLTGAGTSVVITDLLAPYLFLNQNLVINFSTQSLIGPIKAMLKKEMVETAQQIIQQNGDISEIIQNIPLRRIFLRKSDLPAKNELTTLVTHYLQSFINNPTIAQILTQVGWVAFESALIGGLLYSSGLGYESEKSLTLSLQNSALRGVIQGSLAYLATATTHHVGAVVNIPIAPITSIAYNLAQGANIVMNPHHATSSIIHATIQTVTDFVIDEAGGFMNIINKNVEHLKQVTSDRWFSWWNKDINLGKIF